MVCLLVLDRDRPQCSDQLGQVSLNDLPHDALIDPKVIVNDAVPKSANAFPIDVGMSHLRIGGQPIRCLTYDLEISCHRIDRAVIQGELFKCEFVRIAEDLFRSVEDVFDE